MKEIYSILVSVIMLMTCYGSSAQSNAIATHSLATAKYAGVYGYGTVPQKGSVGFVSVYPETDSSILFYIELNRGAPSYNMGYLYGRVKILDGLGMFHTMSFEYENKGCRWSFHFTKDKLTIKTENEERECGFGGNVNADGDYKRKSYVSKEYFVDSDQKKIFFKTTSPELYYNYMK